MTDENLIDATVIKFGGSKGRDWVMRIIIRDEEKDVRIEFNREAYPSCLPDDFAREVADILCRCGYLSEFKSDRGWSFLPERDDGVGGER